MTDQPPKTGAVHHVSFQARVAGVALITTVVVLVAACLTFMLQQWAVAREQNHQAHVALSSITAGASASALAAKDLGAARASIATLSNDSSVTEARLNDASGRAVSVYARPEPANAEALVTACQRDRGLPRTRAKGRSGAQRAFRRSRRALRGPVMRRRYGRVRPVGLHGVHAWIAKVQ